MKKGSRGNIYNLTPENGYAVRDVVRMICDSMGRDFEASTNIVVDRLAQDAAYVIDSARAREELRWRTKISLQEGLAEVIAWIQDNWEQIQHETLEYVHQP